MWNVVLTLVGMPVAIALGCWLGRRYQRMHWELHLPYEERVRRLRASRA